jgi:hypothetical protein
MITVGGTMPKHYNLGPVKPDCTVKGCTNPQYGNELCNGHNQQRRRGAELKPLRAKVIMGACAVCSDGTRGALRSSGEPLCRRHHSIWQRHGDARYVTRNQIRQLATDALSYMIENRDRSECWTDWETWPCWEGLNGYGGTVTVGYPTVGRDRFMHTALELDGRPKPPAPNNHGLHSCAQKLCLNPDHLRWGSHRENMLDLQAERGYCKHCAHCNG